MRDSDGLVENQNKSNNLHTNVLGIDSDTIPQSWKKKSLIKNLIAWYDSVINNNIKLFYINYQDMITLSL